MADVYGYDFNNMGRSGNDMAFMSMRDVGNNTSVLYQTTNYQEGNCNMGRQIAFATRQPAVIYSGPHEGGQGGCLIDVGSKLKIGSIQTHPRARISLQERPFLTIPYLGKGKYDADAEFALRQGSLSLASERKSVATTSDMNVLTYRYIPQLPTIKANIQKPNNLIEETAASGWIRGGISTRDIPRDNDYIRRKQQGGQ